MKCYCGKTIENIYPGRKYCSIFCRSNDKEFCKKLSKKKTELYQDTAWKAATESKKIITTQKNYGVPYPMQNIDIFERQQAACFQKDENGLHGYEPFAYTYLSNLYSTIQNGTKYLKDNNLIIKWIGKDNKEHRSYPDFFCEEIMSFIEIKSEYTRRLHNEKLIKCKESLFDMGYGYIILVINPNKSFLFETYNIEHIKE